MCDYAWHTAKLYPTRRNAASGKSPIEAMSGGSVTRDDVERMIEYAVQPGTLCQVHVPGHHGGALDAVNNRLGIARRMEGDVAVFESHETGHHEFRSKNYWAYDLRPGLSAHAYLRQKTDPHRKPTGHHKLSHKGSQR